MGNKITRRRPVVDERYTRPQGLYPCRDVDQRKLRRLILDAKLAPCFPGAEEPATDLEECPICFLQYPSLNRSKCCAKGVCTECFLQLKAPHSTRPTQCPFCKTPSYAVEYRGAKTLEEKGLEQAEEQKVIEAKIRMRQQEAQEDEERAKRRKEDLRLGRVRSHHPRSITPVDEPEEDLSWNNAQQVRFGTESNFYERSTSEVDQYQRVDRTAPLQQPAVSVSSNFMPSMNQQQQQQQPEIEFPAPRFPLRREDEFELDLEDIMVMEAIWLSIQEQGARHRFADIVESPEIIEADVGLAGAIAALAERQAVNQRINTAPATTRSMHPEANDEQETGELHQENNLPSTSQESEISSSSTRPEPHQEQSLMRKNVESNTAPSPSEITNGSNDEVFVPDNFEEQMMLAMALSIARSGPLPQPVQ